MDSGLGQEGDYEGAQKAFDRALTIARHEGDKELELWTLANRAHVAIGHWELQDVVEASQAALKVGSIEGYHGARFSSQFSLLFALLESGNLLEARLIERALLEAAEDLRSAVATQVAFLSSVSIAMAVGDWDAAREASDCALAAIPEDGRAIGQRIHLEFQVGEFEGGRASIDQLLQTIEGIPPGPTWDYAAVAVVIPEAVYSSGIEYRIEAAASAARVILESPFALPLAQAQARMGQALIAVVHRDVEAAEELYVPRNPNQWTYVMSHVSGERLLGLLAHTMGKLDESASHFEDGLTFCRKAGFRPQLAWTLCDYADMLLDRDSKGDRARAITLLDESLAISSDLGMRPLMERVLSRKMNLQGIDVSSPQTSIDAVVSAVEIDRPNLQSHAAPDGTVTVMFTDIEGSTAMTERLGDQKAQDVLHIHNAIIREQVAAHEGFEVKSEGDGFMLAFSSARRALECAQGGRGLLRQERDPCGADNLTGHRRAGPGVVAAEGAGGEQRGVRVRKWR